MDFFTVFSLLLWGLFVCCLYLAASFTRAQIESKEADPEYEIEYRIDQTVCLWIAVACFWMLPIYSIYSIVGVLIK